jgi:hypothetical protein
LKAIYKHTTPQKQNRKYMPFSFIESDSGFDVDELYILTTSVDARAALAAHGLAHSQVYVRMAEIRLKLQTLLADYAPLKSRTWEERYKAGEVEPLMQVVERYRDTPLALKAIDTLTNGTKVLQVVTPEKERKMVTYYRKKCRQQIAAAYGQAAAF